METENNDNSALYFENHFNIIFAIGFRLFFIINIDFNKLSYMK